MGGRHAASAEDERRVIRIGVTNLTRRPTFFRNMRSFRLTLEQFVPPRSRLTVRQERNWPLRLDVRMLRINTDTFNQRGSILRSHRCHFDLLVTPQYAHLYAMRRFPHPASSDGYSYRHVPIRYLGHEDGCAGRTELKTTRPPTMDEIRFGVWNAFMHMHPYRTKLWLDLMDA